jgi:polysaccharide biosynthesis/export protein
MRSHSLITAAGVALLLSSAAPSIVRAQAPAAHAASTAAVPVVPGDYLIGADDALSIVFWRDKDMSADVVVRPDGKISLPLLNEVQAAGYTPEQLREKLVEAASKYVQEPNATVVVKEIRSRKVFITGNVAKPASYSLVGEMNVLQLIAQAGGLLEYADSKNIVVLRKENGKEQHLTVNYNDVVKRRNVQQNIALKPGDTVIVP